MTSAIAFEQRGAIGNPRRHELPLIYGTITVFNSWSSRLFDMFERFGNPCVEIIRCGAFDRVVTEEPPPLKLNHARELLPAGSNRIRWWTDTRAFHCVIDPPKTFAFSVLTEQIATGELTGMSFRMFLEECTTRTSPGGHVREVLSIPRLDDISIVDRPAYSSTKVRLIDRILFSGRPAVDKAQLRLAVLEAES